MTENTRQARQLIMRGQAMHKSTVVHQYQREGPVERKGAHVRLHKFYFTGHCANLTDFFATQGKHLPRIIHTCHVQSGHGQWNRNASRTTPYFQHIAAALQCLPNLKFRLARQPLMHQIIIQSPVVKIGFSVLSLFHSLLSRVRNSAVTNAKLNFFRVANRFIAFADKMMGIF